MVWVLGVIVALQLVTLAGLYVVYVVLTEVITGATHARIWQRHSDDFAKFLNGGE